MRRAFDLAFLALFLSLFALAALGVLVVVVRLLWAVPTT